MILTYALVILMLTKSLHLEVLMHRHVKYIQDFPSTNIRTCIHTNFSKMHSDLNIIVNRISYALINKSIQMLLQNIIIYDIYGNAIKVNPFILP